jgi:hypothetical protein
LTLLDEYQNEMADEVTAWHEALKAFPTSKLHSLTLNFNVTGHPGEHWSDTSFWGYPIYRIGFLRCPDSAPKILTIFAERIARLVKKTSKGQCVLELDGEREVVHALLNVHVFWSLRR